MSDSTSSRALVGLAFWTAFVVCCPGVLAAQSAATAARPARIEPIEVTANRIRDEALRPNQSDVGRALPLLSGWNTGGTGEGFVPSFQIQQIDRGHVILPWLGFPGPDAAPEPRGRNQALEWLNEARLPLTLVSTQWESILTNQARYFSLSSDQNPNVVEVDGAIDKKLSPFGPIGPWIQAGREWGSSPNLTSALERYRDPPRIIFLSNNEHAKLRWTELGVSKRYLEKYGRHRDDDFQRRVVGDGWIERYRAFQSGFRAELPEGLRARSLFVGYNAFGPCHFARWGAWTRHSLTSGDRIDPSPLMWDGGSPPYYLNHWEAITDYTVYSPQIQAMNWVFMKAQAERLNPGFWFELSIWDGYLPGNPKDKREFFRTAGHPYRPARHEGMTQFGMWLLRPRVVREFRSHRDRRVDVEEYFEALARAVDRVHRQPTLTRFWRQGTLVVNPSEGHPYQSAVPKEFESAPRWFLLDANVNPPRPWKLTTELPVFSLSLVMGKAPTRSWLVYSHAPLGERRGVQLTLPEYGPIQVDATVAGSFHVVDEQTKLVTPIPSNP